MTDVIRRLDTGTSLATVKKVAEIVSAKEANSFATTLNDDKFRVAFDATCERINNGITTNYKLGKFYFAYDLMITVPDRDLRDLVADRLEKYYTEELGYKITADKSIGGHNDHAKHIITFAW